MVWDEAHNLMVERVTAEGIAESRREAGNLDFGGLAGRGTGVEEE